MINAHRWIPLTKDQEFEAVLLPISLAKSIRWTNSWFASDLGDLDGHMPSLPCDLMSPLRFET